MWPDRRLTDLLGIEAPIIQAPMLGSSTADLAVAVTNAGGLGSVAFGAAPGDDLAALHEDLHRATNGPVNYNFFVGDAVPGAKVAPEVRARLGLHYSERGLGDPAAEVPPSPACFADNVLAALLEIRPRVVSFQFGIPSVEKVRTLQAAGIIVMSSATCVREARALDDAGVDVIIAQGWEAGGHRGSHAANLPGDGVGTMALVPQVVDSVRAPVVAAGGIGDGRGIAAAFALGASGVQMGTAFLGCPEAATDARRRDLLRRATDEDTTVTSAVSGRPARAVESRYSADLADLAGRLPPFPAMYALSRPLLEACRDGADEVAGFHLYGQAAALTLDLPAADLLARLVADTRAAFRRLGAAAPGTVTT